MRKVVNAALLFFSAAALCAAPAKKMIECSWSNPTTDVLRKNIAELEANIPYQGMRIYLTGRGDGKGQNHKTIFGKVRWKYEWFKEDVENLKNTKFTRFTDNFFSTGVVPGNVDWFSDSDWETVCGNFGLVARIAKETNVKGFIFDPEEYKAHLWHRISAQGHTLEEIAAKARQRGQEFGRAVFTAYPNLTLFCFAWMAYAKGSPVFRGFINGIYDVLPQEAKIVDGDESGGYTAINAGSLHARVNEMKKLAELIDPANRAKFFLQTSYAPAMYLECVAPRTEGSVWHRILKRGFGQLSTREFLRRHLESSLEVSDEYVWTYSEYRSWTGAWVDGWKSNTWESWVPGITECFLAAQDPLGFARREIAEKKPANLLKNPKLIKAEKGPLPEGWGLWQGRDSKGTIEYKPGVNGVFYRNAVDANLSQRITLVPNKRYLLRLRGRVTRDRKSPSVSLSASLTWRFEASGSNWLIGAGKSLALPPTGKDETAELVFIVPPDAPNLFLSLKGKNQNNADDTVMLESCELFPLSDLADSPNARKPQPVKQKKKAAAPKLAGSDPAAAGMSVTGANLVTNPEFTASTAKAVCREWAFWQGKQSHGTFRPEADADGKCQLVLRNASGGLIYQFVKIIPGQYYELRFTCESDQPVKLFARWGSEKKRWTLPNMDRAAECVADGTVRTAVLRVKAPEKASYIVLAFSGTGTVKPIKAEVHQLQ